ncbi:MAG: hypothetical protein WD317_04870 [Balneolaceae bacterium]
MINFHSITIEAKELIDVFYSPVELYLDDRGEYRNINFSNGDCADVFLTDGSQFLIQYENDQWVCRQFNPKESHAGDPVSNGRLVSVYGPYEFLEDALNDLVAKKNYISVN